MLIIGLKIKKYKNKKLEIVKSIFLKRARGRGRGEGAVRAGFTNCGIACELFHTCTAKLAIVAVSKTGFVGSTVSFRNLQCNNRT